MPEVGLDTGFFMLDQTGKKLEKQVERLVEWSDWFEKWSISTIVQDDLSSLLLEVGAPIYHHDLQQILDMLDLPYSAIDIETVLWGFVNTSVEISDLLITDTDVVASSRPDLCIHEPCHSSTTLSATVAFLDICSWLYGRDELDFFGVVSCSEISELGVYSSEQRGAVHFSLNTIHGELHLEQHTKCETPLFGSIKDLARSQPGRVPPVDKSDKSIALAIHLEALHIAAELDRPFVAEIAFTMGPSFCDSIRALNLLNTASSCRQLFRACAEAVLGTALTEAHRMRVSSGGNSDYRTSKDKRYLNRRTVNASTGLRLHSWDAGISGVELATVAVHDDYSVPDPSYR